MRSLVDQDVRALLPPRALFAEVEASIKGGLLEPDVDEERHWCTTPIAAKAGQSRGLFGFRARIGGGVPSYVTVLRSSEGETYAVESNYLTYYRTAALGLLGPFWVLGRNLRTATVVGHGPLSDAVVELMTTIWPAATVNRRNHSEPTIDASSDLVVAATRARKALPALCAGQPWPWLVLLGSVRRREELEALTEMSSGRLWFTDSPRIVAKRKLLHEASALSTVRALNMKDGVQFGGIVCGGGSIDIELARIACAVIDWK